MSCANMACYQWPDITIANEIGSVLLYLVGHSTILLLLALYLGTPPFLMLITLCWDLS